MKKLLLILMMISSSQVHAQTLPQVTSNCQEADYVNADVRSSIAIAGHSYTPKCLKVLVGSEVTIQASKRHPLAPQSSAKGIIPVTENTTTVQFLKSGVYGYFCTDHGNSTGQGMAGAIWVVESF